MGTTKEGAFKRYCYTAAVAVFLGISAPAIAQGPGWTASSTIVQLAVTANGGVNVRLSPELSNCTSQSMYGPLFASIYPDHPGIDRIKADLLAAYMTGTPVALYLHDSTCKVTEIVLGSSLF